MYLITDCAQTAGRPLLEVVASALHGGIRAVQLRERGLATRELLALAESLRALTRQHGAALLVNDRVDVALACDADGVHLPARSFAVADARRLLGAQRLIGVSTHAPAELSAADAAGADFAVFGPLYDTPSKRTYGSALGPAALADARRATALPLFAIGGLDLERVTDVHAHGADGVAVIRAVLAAAEPAAAAAALLGRCAGSRRRGNDR